MTLVHLHANEITAKEVAVSYLEHYGGQLISIENGVQRNVQFRLNNNTYEFDPNRMFTKEGVEQSLQLYSKVDNEAITAIAAFAKNIWQLIPDTSLIVALHNNTNAQYSVLDYESGILKDDAKSVYLHHENDTDNFIFTTDIRIFDYFKQSKINAVLQKNITTVNDGSMSIVLGRQNRSYVNIEAEHGQRSIQLNMLMKLHEFLLKHQKLSVEMK
jgi:formamidopyrimidine-DNA glycosylase